MPRMNDKQFAEAERLARELHAYLDKHGDEGDEFSEIWNALEGLVGKKGLLAHGDGRSTQRTEDK